MISHVWNQTTKIYRLSQAEQRIYEEKNIFRFKLSEIICIYIIYI